MKIETLPNPWPEMIVYAQLVRSPTAVLKMLHYIILEPIERKTYVTIEVRYLDYPVFGKFLENWVRKKVVKHAENMLSSFKMYNF